MRYSFSKVCKVSFTIIIISLVVICFSTFFSLRSVDKQIREELKVHTDALDAVSQIALEFSELGIIFQEKYAARNTDIEECIALLNTVRRLLNSPAVVSVDDFEIQDKLLRNERICRTLLYAYSSTLFQDPTRDFGKQSLDNIVSVLRTSKKDAIEYCNTAKNEIDRAITAILVDLQKANRKMFYSLGTGIFIVIGMVIVMSRSLEERLQKITEAADNIRSGHTDYRINMPFRDSLGNVAYRIDLMAEKIQTSERALVQANEILSEALDQAKRADVAKSEFLANMSHEIRTPMNAIIGFTDILKEEELTEDQHSYITTIDESAQNLLRIINDILDFSKIDAGQMHIDIDSISLDELVAYVESLMAPIAAQKGIEFRVKKSSVLPHTITTDGLRIRQCLINLVNNAIKFTEQGYVCLNISQDVCMACTHIVFTVEDTGIGISEDKLDVIFQSFQQVDGTMTRKYGGTGLGLTITKKLVELLGGSISVESEPGRGSRFSISIPIEAGELAVTAAESLS